MHSRSWRRRCRPVTRIHVVSLPHTLLTRSYDWCAYTAKVRRFVDMLTIGGHEAFVYGPDIHDQFDLGVEYVPIVDGLDRKTWFGSEEWDTAQVFDHWDTEHISWQTMNTRAALTSQQSAGAVTSEERG